MKYIIDGSRKGMVIGAGIVEIDNYGFFENHSFSKNHISATSTLGEFFAMDSALSLISKKEKDLISRVHIYSDNLTVIKTFNQGTQEEALSKDVYIHSLQKQFILLKKFIEIEVSYITEEYKAFHSFAHCLSRSYMNESDKKVTLEAIQPNSIQNNKKKKPRLTNNEQVMRLDVLKEGNSWELLINGVSKDKDKKFKNIINRFVGVNQNKIGKEFIVEPSEYLTKMLHNVRHSGADVGFDANLNILMEQQPIHE